MVSFLLVHIEELIKADIALICDYLIYLKGNWHIDFTSLQKQVPNSTFSEIIKHLTCLKKKIKQYEYYI